MTLAIVLASFVGLIVLFKFLFQTITNNEIDWWDSITFVMLGAILRRILGFLSNKLEWFPNG